MDELFPSALMQQTTRVPPAPFVIRPLRLGDFDKGYVECLAQLTKVGAMSRELFTSRFRSMERMNRYKGTYYCIVVEDAVKRKIVG